jgi:hypothetical protein
MITTTRRHGMHGPWVVAGWLSRSVTSAVEFVRLLSGALGEIVPPRRLVAAAVRHATLNLRQRRIEGHVVHLTEPQEAHELVIDLLRRVEPGCRR